MKMQRLLFSACFCVLGLALSAQVDQEIISVGDRELTVDQAFKIAELPSTIDTTTSHYKMTYETLPRQVDVEYEVKPIKAAKLKVMEPLTKLYRGYVKAGIGMYTTPLVQLRYNSIRSRDWAYGIHYDHLSSNGGIKNRANSSYSDNVVDLWARRFLRKHTLETGVNYERNVNHYYGFDPGDVDINKNDIEQRYRTLGFRAVLQSHYRDSSKLAHRITAGYQSTKNSWGTKEGNFKLGTRLSKFEGIYQFILGASLDVNNVSCPEQLNFIPDTTTAIPAVDMGQLSHTNTIIDISPTIKTQKEDLTAEVGIGIVTDGKNSDEVAGDGTRFRFYPRAYVSYSLFDDLFTPYAGLTGGLERNSHYTLSRENPYVLPCLGLTNTSTNYELYGGVRGTIIDDLSFNVKVGLSAYEDYAFFVNDTVQSNETAFTVIYDDMKAFSINGELSYKHNTELTFTAGLTLTTYNTDKLEKAYNLPAAEFFANATYDLNDQFVVKATVFTASTRYGATPVQLAGEPQVEGLSKRKLKGYVDSNLSFEYRYTKKISAFLTLNNMTGGRYQRWNNYQVQTFMALGGLTYSF